MFEVAGANRDGMRSVFCPKKGQVETDLASWLEAVRNRRPRSRSYFVYGAGAGVTVSLCCAHAPKLSALAAIATIMIAFKIFTYNFASFRRWLLSSFRRGNGSTQRFSPLFLPFTTR